MPVLQRSDCSILAASRREAVASTLGAPPLFLDLAWREGPDGRWIADATPLARIAGELCRKGMLGFGIAVRDGIVAWDLAQAPDEPRRSKMLRMWEKTARSEAARREARDAQFRPIDAEALAIVKAELHAALTAAPWAFGLKCEIAEGFAEADLLTPGQHRFAKALLQDARCVVAAVDRRLAEPAGQEDLAAAQDADTREDLLAACRFLSALDGDRCRDRNGGGWGASTTGSGHRLASLDELSVLQAAHARQLVYPHRAQLPPALRDRLFG